tara:strand:- start:1301 stop:2074 length:774 start_codon:yes stop_codon:yes gene_type:complete
VTIIKKIIKSFFNLFGLRISRSDHFRVLIDRSQWTPFKDNNHRCQLYQSAIKKAESEHTDEFYKQLRFYSMIQIVEKILSNDKVYDFVECGCWKGHSSFMISQLIKESNKDIQFHIFDSFEGGLSTSTPEDSDFYNKDEAHKKYVTEFFYSTENFVRDTVLKQFNFVKTYSGWIPDRFHEIKDKKFSFVHLDVDLYNPTYDSLDYFFPKLEPGGAIVCDDYNMSQFPGAKDAWDKYFQNKKYNFFYESPFGGCFIIK